MPDNFVFSLFPRWCSVRFFTGRNAITSFSGPLFDVTLFSNGASANRFTGKIEKKINDVSENLLTKNHAGYTEFFFSPFPVVDVSSGLEGYPLCYTVIPLSFACPALPSLHLLYFHLNFSFSFCLFLTTWLLPFALACSLPRSSPSFVDRKSLRRRVLLVFRPRRILLQRNFLTPRSKPRLVILATLRSLVPLGRETARETGRLVRFPSWRR